MRDVDSKDWCHAGGQLLGHATTIAPGSAIACELCGKPVKIVGRFGDFGYPAYPRHKKSSAAIQYEWVDHDGDVHRTDTSPNACETPLGVRVIAK